MNLNIFELNSGVLCSIVLFYGYIKFMCIKLIYKLDIFIKNKARTFSHFHGQNMIENLSLFYIFIMDYGIQLRGMLNHLRIFLF